MKEQISVACKVCNTENAMIPDKLPNSTKFYHVLGWIMIISAFILLIAYSICFIGIAINYQGHPFYIYGLCFLGVFVIASVAVLIMGMRFRAKKKAYKCLVCGSVIDRK